MDRKEFLKSLAKDTINISKNRKYKYKNTLVPLNPIGNTKYYKEGYVFKIPENATIFKETKIEVRNESTIDAIMRRDDNLGVLNFASARHPGGGFINGAVAQEECLAYCSDLYETQNNNDGPQYYIDNNACGNHSYTNGLIITENAFFRDSKNETISTPVYCTVVTCPAVNIGQVIQHNESVTSAKSKMKNRMRIILNAFIFSRCTKIILGSFGCGVFKNNPEEIAKYWYELLFDENLVQYFEEITFSILDLRNTNNIDPFIKRFKKMR